MDHSLGEVMPDYNLITAGQIVNTIVADEDFIASISDQYDSIEEVIEEENASDSPRTWRPDDVRQNLTLAEKAVWDNDSAPEVVTAKIELAEGLEETETTEVLDFLVAASVISADSKTAVLA